MLQHVVPDRVHQMRLAETHAAVDEERVVRARRGLGNGAAGRMRELIRRSDDERVERVAGVQAADGPAGALEADALRALGRSGSSGPAQPESRLRDEDEAAPGRRTSASASDSTTE